MPIVRELKAGIYMKNNIEKTLVLIKPDGLRKTNEILNKYEENGLKINKMFLSDATSEQLDEHYQEHIGKIFYNELKNDMMQGHIFIMEVCGENAVSKVRRINGATDPLMAKKGTIRGDFGITGEALSKNLVHASDSIESANRELNIWLSAENV